MTDMDCEKYHTKISELVGLAVTDGARGGEASTYLCELFESALEQARSEAFEEAARLCETEYEIDGPGAETYGGGYNAHGQEAAAIGLAAAIRQRAKEKP